MHTQRSIHTKIIIFAHNLFEKLSENVSALTMEWLIGALNFSSLNHDELITMLVMMIETFAWQFFPFILPQLEHHRKTH